MFKCTFKALFCLLPFVVLSNAQAGISLGATRIIFEAKNKEENITVRNESEKPILLQSWLDNGKEGDGAVPFAVTPPLTKMAANGQQLLRVLYKGAGLPQDRESVVWLSVQEIPASVEGKNTLQIAVRQKIKVFYRPANLTGEAKDAAGSLQWQLEDGGKRLSVHNPSAYHVSMVQLLGEMPAFSNLVAERFMVAPGERKTFEVNNGGFKVGAEFSFRSINDWGGQETYRTKLQAASSSTATRVDAQ
ncbi:molecular chaperone [Pseudomonas sp. ANT_J12]|jgi:chaperone protein EcpD|uniref:fimbrial biogenesis chaperone n=1 Tax=Pseudomonas sp. ANT_J12 TaxID=2597351 RepID=UPI0011F0CD2B|nr:molecular chaperone [Pseudomonas sp. ANT_J12]KAA0983002.1 molecular chaperone [Pseudomonas sp. ANT_J12]